ncbi:MAG TPA: hypothetical protein VF137_03015 [Candidatus Dormibacteraeota bacterium]
MEVKDITNAVDNAADVATGAVISAAEAFSNPRRTVERETARLERKGAPARRKIDRELGSTIDDAQELAEALLPERIVLRGLSLVKARARRVDLVGEIAYRGLDVFHGSLSQFSRAIDRIERASTPPARPKRSVGRAARTTATETRTAARRTNKRASRRVASTRRTAARRSA